MTISFEFQLGVRGANSGSQEFGICGGRWPGARQPELIERSAAFRCVDLLNRVGHGDRAREYAAELESLVSEIAGVSGSRGMWP